MVLPIKTLFGGLGDRSSYDLKVDIVQELIPTPMTDGGRRRLTRSGITPIVNIDSDELAKIGERKLLLSVGDRRVHGHSMGYRVNKQTGLHAFDITDSSGFVWLALAFNETDSGNLQLRSETGSTVELQLSSSPIEFGLGLVSAWIGLLMSIGKRTAYSRGSHTGSGKSSEALQQGHCDRSPDGIYRFSHSFDCDLPVDGIITRDGRIYIYVFCLLSVERIEINVLDCCKDHDVDMWCSENNLEALIADEKVVACVTAAILDQGLAKLNPVCGVLVGGYAQILTAVAALYPIISAIAGFANLGHDDVLIGYGGRNRDSCLCGGTEPTALCRDPCRDICQEYGKTADCSRCKFICSYDPQTGQPIGYKHQPDPNGRRCCPGTQDDVECYPTGDIRRNCGSKKPTKTCFDCYYDCEVCHTYHWKYCRNPGVGTLRKVSADGLPCCDGTPKPFKGYCPTEHERSVDQKLQS